MRFRRTLAHVTKKCGEIMTPFFAHPDATTAVQVKVVIGPVVAPTFGLYPCAIGVRRAISAAVAMFRSTTGGLFVLATTASSRASRNKQWAMDVAFRTADASTQGAMKIVVVPFPRAECCPVTKYGFGCNRVVHTPYLILSQY
jgi:hypothetical protein